MTRESAVAAEKKTVLTARRRLRSPSPSRDSSLLSPAVANIASQEKRIQRSARERLENRRYTSKIKNYFRRDEDGGRGGDAGRSETEDPELAPTIERAGKGGAADPKNGGSKKARAVR